MRCELEDKTQGPGGGGGELSNGKILEYMIVIKTRFSRLNYDLIYILFFEFPQKNMFEASVSQYVSAPSHFIQMQGRIYLPMIRIACMVYYHPRIFLVLLKCVQAGCGVILLLMKGLLKSVRSK